MKKEEVIDVQLKLEKLARECITIGQNYWNDKIDLKKEKDTDLEDKSNNSDDEYNKLYKNITNRIAITLSEILTGEPICVAPNYREIKGGLIQSKIFEKHFSKYTNIYGSLAEDGKLIIPKNEFDRLEDEDEYKGLYENNQLKIESYFMPVAFWTYKIYEKKMEFIDAMGEKHAITMKGFSGWTAEYGLLARKEKKNDEDKPVYGFHFTYDDSMSNSLDGSFDKGLLRYNFHVEDKKKPHLTALRITDQFKDRLFDSKNELKKGSGKPITLSPEQKEVIQFPIIDGANDDEMEMIENVFSIFFYSNFKELPAEDDEEWKKFLEKIELEPVDTSQYHENYTYSSLEELMNYYFAKYKEMYSDAKNIEKTEKNDKSILLFKHFYSFLLNPDIDFAKKSDAQDGYSSLGTVNLYTMEAVGSDTIGLIKTNLELIYHFLRGIEEWEEGEKEGKALGSKTAFEQMNGAMGHEVSKVYSSALTFMGAHRPDYYFNNDICQLSHKIIEKTLQYGLLWGKSNYAVIPDGAILWDPKRGAPVDNINGFIDCVISQSWFTFLISEVLRDISARDLSFGLLNRINNIWNAPLLDLVDYDQTIRVVNTGWKETPTLTTINKALYRWFLAVLSNAWKHLVKKDLTSIAGELIEEKIKLVEKTIDTWRQANNKIISILFLQDMAAEKLTISIENIITSSTAPVKKTPSLEKTFLVMALAGQEIIKGLNEDEDKANKEEATLDEIAEKMKFHIGDNKKWVASIILPFLEKESEG